MKTGISTACFFGRELNEDALRIIGENEVRDAELFFSTSEECEPIFTYDLRRICDDTGVKVRSVHALTTAFEPQLVSHHPRQYAAGVREFHRVVAAANRLGAGVYVFHGPMDVRKANTLHIDFGHLAERMSTLADIAKDYDVKLCYETVHWCWYQRPDFATELLANATSDNLFFTLDMKQCAQSGYEISEYLDLMQGRLAHVHLCDFMADPQEGIVPAMPFEGQAPWMAMRGKLQELHFDGYLMLEVYTRNYSDTSELMESYRRVQDFFA